MALKTEVLDRIPTYPGRVKLTPVSGAADTYDLVRADQPIEVGTPINKKLFDQKAYCLTENVTVYVATTGSDLTGDGTAAAPYATIQKAVDSLPKWFDGHTATIDIAVGTYEERVIISGFQGGTLVVGIAGRAVTISGINVSCSKQVRLNVANISRVDTIVGTLLYITDGSEVVVNSAITVAGASKAISGIVVERNSQFTAADGVTVTVKNCANSAILASSGARVALLTVAGSNNGVGIWAETGATVSHGTRTLTAVTANMATNGGRIYSGGQSSIPNY